MQTSPDMFINRELSWLRFNSRVLDQCSKNFTLVRKIKIYSYILH